MRPSLLAALLATSLLLAGSAHAARWQLINGKGTAAPMRSEVDADSIHPVNDGSIRLWHREVYRKPHRPESGEFSYTRLTMLNEFQCAKRSAALVQRSYTAADGSELKSESFDTLDYQPVPPDSTLEAVLTYACQHAKASPPVAAKTAPPATTPAPATSSPPVLPPEPGAAPPTAAAPASPATPVTKPAGKKAAKKEAEEPPRHAHWSYGGATGPEQWGKLDAQYETCASGQRQSPIDIRRTLRADLPTIQFDYRPVPLAIVDNGHSIKVDTSDAGSITVDGESYALQQFHFHRPSEEKIGGKAYAMVAHLVHQSKAGKLAVVAVLFEAGKEQPLIRTLWNNLPLEQDKPVVRADLRINPLELLPAKRGYYTFLGSLTTPPCSEGVLWLVLKTPVQASKEQLAGFSTIYRNNVRPVQPVNGRLIKESR